MRRIPRVLRHFSLFLALRYLRPKRTFVSVITVISILGVALGVTALVVVIAVMRGFEEEIKKLIIGFEPHIAIIDQSAQGIPDHERVPWKDIQREVAKFPAVKATSAYIESPVLIERLGPDGESLDGANAEPIAMFAFPSIEGDPLYDKFSKLPMRTELVFEFPDDPGGTNTLDLLPGDEEGVPPPPALPAPERVEHTPKFDLGGEFGGNSIVVGERVAEKLGIIQGDRVLVYDPNKLKTLVQELRRQGEEEPGTEEEREADRQKIREREEQTLPSELTVTGVFKNPRYGHHVLLSLVTAQELLDLSETAQVHGVAVELDDPYLVDRVEKALHDAGLVPWGWATTHWIRRHQHEFQIIQSERAMLYLVLFILVLVGAFCVMNTMITVTVQKRKEIGVMGALGARVSQVVWIFLSQGIVVGVIGTLLGLGLGELILWSRNTLRYYIAEWFGMEIFSEKIYGVSEIPAMLLTRDIVYITSGSFLLCSIAALIPAWMAARTHPAETLRAE